MASNMNVSRRYANLTQFVNARCGTHWAYVGENVASGDNETQAWENMTSPVDDLGRPTSRSAAWWPPGNAERDFGWGDMRGIMQKY